MQTFLKLLKNVNSITSVSTGVKKAFSHYELDYKIRNICYTLCIIVATKKMQAINMKSINSFKPIKNYLFSNRWSRCRYCSSQNVKK